MPDKKLTDNEIKKTLECCLFGDCQDCFYGDTDQRCCRDDLMQNCLDCFNRLQAEKEELQTQNYWLIQEKAKIDKTVVEMLATAKAQAYKEFAERLKEEATVDDDSTWWIANIDVDNLLKEMVGEDNESTNKQ